MKNEIKKWFNIWRIDYIFRTILSSAASAFLGVVYALYNGALGIIHGSVWNGTICVYYMLLVIIRAILLNSHKKTKKGTLKKRDFKRIVITAHTLFFLMNVSMIAPVAFMILGEKDYNLGLIPAIAMAAYTTYRITLAIINYRKSTKTSNPTIKSLRTLNLAEALMAIITLQNSLILLNGSSYGKSMTILATISCTAILGIIILSSVFSLLFSIKNPPSELLL